MILLIITVVVVVVVMQPREQVGRVAEEQVVVVMGQPGQLTRVAVVVVLPKVLRAEMAGQV